MSSEWQHILDAWGDVKVPPAPEIEFVEVQSHAAALLVLDIQDQNCSDEQRPRCVATVPGIKMLIDLARMQDMPVIYSTTSSADQSDIRSEITPNADETVVKSGVDKFHGTELESILSSKGVKSVIIVGTSAHGAVLHTAAAAVARGLEVIVPVDGISADTTYAEQYTAWHLKNSPGTRKNTRLTAIASMRFRSDT
jgi:nicotinamidase-related amidase